VRLFRSEPIAVSVGLVAFSVPILLSLQLAWMQSVADEKAEGLRYASAMVRRGEETAEQFGRAIQLLNEDHLPRCSPQEIDLMRQIDVGSSYLQMVARISGDTLDCTSLGTVAPIHLGAPTLVTENGVAEWLDFKWGPAQPDRLDLIDSNGVAILVDTGLLIDLETEGDDVKLALMVPSTAGRLRLVEPKGKLLPQWLNPIGRGQSISFVDGQYIVSQVRSKTRDFEAVSVIPIGHAYRHVAQFAIAFVPIGLVCGLGIGWAVMHFVGLRSSPQAMIRAAARNHNFYVEYQPVVDLTTRKIVGAEALVRWKRGNTVISPASFIPLAEESGVISLITENVMDIVSRDLPRLVELDPKFRVAINFSATDLKSDLTIDKLMGLLRKSGASSQNLIVEATEHGLISGPETCKVVATIREAGFRVAIDDFGTGYSSLSCLQSLGLDFLKIDKSFVDNIGTDGVTSEVVLHIIEIARSLRLRIVAEGVETEAQAAFLKKRNVEFAQGWLFGRPMTIDSICSRIGQNSSMIEESPAASSILTG
jgi:sensor c-di-GMP phosphodiesterase-like protein